MTSSLVGSEMCIRDSSTFVRVTLGEVRLRTEDENSTRASQNVTARFPVSYTHLTLPTICSV
eukprot:12842658-Prorocentrum_lima.AAC.1